MILKEVIEMKSRVIRSLMSVVLAVSVLCMGTGCSSDTKSDVKNTNDKNSSVSENADEQKTDSNASDSQTASGTITVTDHSGNAVEVPSDIERIVVTDPFPLPSVLSVFFDSADKIVGMPPQSMSAAKNSILSELYPEILDASTDFSGESGINIEELITLDPDVVFYSAGSADTQKKLESAGIPAVAVSASKWEYDAPETLENWLDLLKQMFPENNRGDKYREYTEKIESLVNEKTKDLSEKDKENVMFLFQYSESSITTSGKHFFGDYWANAAGAKNAGSEIDKENAAPVNMEQVYEWDPTVIFITNYTTAQPEDIYGNLTGSYDWSGINAVQNKRVYKMPLGMYRSYTPGIDSPVTLLWLAKTIYPEKFADVDITEETKKYYKEIFDVELTDEQAEKIFKPAKQASAY